jgi:hypothetical protein
LVMVTLLSERAVVSGVAVLAWEDEDSAEAG